MTPQQLAKKRERESKRYRWRYKNKPGFAERERAKAKAYSEQFTLEERRAYQRVVQARYIERHREEANEATET